MSKSILVIDTPKSCSECILCEPINKDNICVVLSRIVTDINGVHPQCPLQPLAPLLGAVEELAQKVFNVGNELYIKSIDNKITKTDCLDVEIELGKLADKIKSALGGINEK